MLSRVGPATIRRAELEDGKTSMTAANAHAVRSALEAAGVILLDPAEGVHDGGVALKPGAKPRAGLPSREGVTGDGEDGLKALEGAEEMVAYWSGHAAEWAALSLTGRYILTREMFGAPEAPDEFSGEG